MKLIHSKPNYDSPFVVPPELRVDCPAPVTFIKFRYAHHAGPSGYSRICDYTDTPVLELSQSVYWMGETLLRPFCIYASKASGKYEYSRYDCTLEIQFLLSSLLKLRNRIFHFIYGEKSFHLTEKFATRLKHRGHKLVGTVHHMPEQQEWLFKSTRHFRCFDQLITMDQASIGYWEGITGKNNVHWVPNGVDSVFFHPVDKNSELVRVLFAGTHERDFDTLGKTIEQLPASEGFVFSIIGKSEKAIALGDRFEHVTVHKWLTDDEYRSVMHQSDILLLPLHSSTFCNVILECMASGLPVVTTQGGIEAYLNSDSSCVTKVGDADALANGVRDLAGRLPEASARARHQAERFSWQAVARKHVDFYQSISSDLNMPTPVGGGH